MWLSHRKCQGLFKKRFLNNITTLLMFLKMCLFERQRDREGETGRAPICWFIPWKVTRSPGTPWAWHRRCPLCCFPRCTGQEVERSGPPLVLQSGCRHLLWYLSPLHPSTGPYVSEFKKRKEIDLRIILLICPQEEPWSFWSWVNLLLFQTETCCQRK